MDALPVARLGENGGSEHRDVYTQEVGGGNRGWVPRAPGLCCLALDLAHDHRARVSRLFGVVRGGEASPIDSHEPSLVPGVGGCR